MKKVFLSIAFGAVCNFLVGCNSNGFQEDKVVAQSDISLVSPKGVRIANSVDELAKMPLSSNGLPVSTPITITKIVYNWENVEAPDVEPTGSQRATIHYKTSTGEKGVYFVEVGRS